MEVKTKAFRLPDETIRGLGQAAKKLDRKESFIVRTAIEQFLTEYFDYEVALSRMRDKDDEIITGGEMGKLIND